MSDASTISIAPAAATPAGFGRLIAPGLVSASVLYFFAISTFLPPVTGASAAIDVFLAAALPGLMVTMLLWAVRPAAFPRQRRRGLVAAALLASAAAAALPMLFAGA
jgi:hypothetical protein